MNRVIDTRRSAAATAAGVLTAAALLATQLFAASKAGIPPTVQFVVAPAPGEKVFYSVPFAWQGADVDGTVSLYRYAIDPPAFGDTFWIATGDTARRFFFQTTSLDLPVPASGPITFSQSHTVVLEAVDDEGLQSDPVSRTFFSSTIAPVVQIVSPTPNPSSSVLIGSDVIVTWQGTDADGVFWNRPVKYKFMLVGPNINFPGGVAGVWGNPDAFRDQYAPLFAAWDSSSSDTTSVHYSHLNVGQRYVFCVVGFDEAGAYSARFGPAINMIQMLVGVTPTSPVTWGRLKNLYR